MTTTLEQKDNHSCINRFILRDRVVFERKSVELFAFRGKNTEHTVVNRRKMGAVRSYVRPKSKPGDTTYDWVSRASRLNHF